MNFLLEVEKSDYNKVIIDWSNGEAILDTFLFGGKMLLIGMITIFAVLCLIWLALAIFNLVFSGKKETVAPVAPTPVVNTVIPSASADEEIVAAITAAIMMAESESNGAKFKVVSFKRI